MKQLLKLILLTIVLTATPASAQEMPRAVINPEYLVSLPTEIPLQEYYFVDISHLDFTDEQEAIYLLTSYVTANLISNEVFYTDGYMVIRIHLEHIPGDEVDLAQLQDYLNHLTKPE